MLRPDGADVGGPLEVLRGTLDLMILKAVESGPQHGYGITKWIRETSGDAFQVDPGRNPAGWSDVVIEGCRFWLAPLPSPANGFPAGTVAGENAIDTKAAGTAPRAKLTIRDTEAHGFRQGLIRNMAAFNLKENIDAVLDGVTAYDSEIAFRIRGPGPNGGPLIRVQNAVVHSSDVAFRYEDDIETAKIYNVTVGGGVARPFVKASSPGTVFDVRNFLMLGPSLPGQAAGSSNRAVPASAFVNAADHNYQLSDRSPAVDAGVAIGEVTHDRRGIPRPQGRGYDVGAYEHPVTPH